MNSTALTFAPWFWAAVCVAVFVVGVRVVASFRRARRTMRELTARQVARYHESARIERTLTGG